MSVYKPKASPFYHFDFQVRGTRFCGSTGCSDRRQAEAVERAEKISKGAIEVQARLATDLWRSCGAFLERGRTAQRDRR